jgi:hypothetical protein
MLHWLRRKKNAQTLWWAGAYLTDGRIVVHSRSGTRNNVGWYNQPVFAVPEGASNDLLGERLREALNASTLDSLEDDSQDKAHTILREAGAGTWRDLEDRSKLVSIETDRDVVKILPSRWVTKTEGGRGFIPLPEIQIEVKWDGSDADLGAALRRGFEA